MLISKKKIGFCVFLVLFSFILIFSAAASYPISTISDNSLTSTAFTKEDAQKYTFTSDKQIVEAYKGSAGYDKYYYSNGTVAIYSLRTTIEVYDEKGKNAQWKQIGIPQDVSLDSSKSFGDASVRHYDNYLGVTYNITSEFDKEGNQKISVDFSDSTKSSGRYRVHFSLDGIVNNFYIENNDSIEFGNIVFNYSDVVQTWGNITTTDITTSAQGRKADFYFDVGVQNEFTLDPSVAIANAIEFILPPIHTSNRHQMIVNSKGDYFTSFIDYVNLGTGYLLVHKSLDYGETWNQIANITVNTLNQCLGGTDMWINSSDSIQIHCSMYSGEQPLYNFWSDDEFVTYQTSNTSGFTNPYIENFMVYPTSNDQAIACVTVVGAIDGVYIYNWTGSNWIQNNASTGVSARKQKYCDIDIDSQNMIHMVTVNSSGKLNHYNTTDCKVVTEVQAFANASTNTNYAGDNIDLAIDSDDNLYVLFSRPTDSTALANSSKDGIDWYSDVNDNLKAVHLGASTDVSLFIDDTDRFHAFAADEDYIFNSRISYSYSDTNGVSWIRDPSYLGGDPADPVYLAPQITNTKYPSQNNASQILRYLYFDDTNNIVYFDSINVQYANPNVTLPISISSNRSSENLTFQINYTHLNRLSALINASWYINGTYNFSSTTTATLSGESINLTLYNTNFTRGNNISVSVYAIDTQSSVSVIQNSTNVTIRNGLPVISGANIVPSSPVETENLVCNFTYSDIDGDVSGGNITYWYKSGVIQPVPNVSVLSNAYTSGNEVWMCSPLANDTFEYSNQINSTSVLVSFTPSSSPSSGGGGGSSSVASIIKKSCRVFLEPERLTMTTIDNVQLIKLTNLESASFSPVYSYDNNYTSLRGDLKAVILPRETTELIIVYENATQTSLETKIVISSATCNDIEIPILLLPEGATKPITETVDEYLNLRLGVLPNGYAIRQYHVIGFLSGIYFLLFLINKSLREYSFFIKTSLFTIFVAATDIFINVVISLLRSSV